jgi:hypothetical protein
MKKIVFLCAAACAASASFAQINSVGEFSGAMNEGFESFNNYTVGGPADTLDVMGGSAEFRSAPQNSNQLYVYEPGLAQWGLGDNGLAEVHTGAKGLGHQDPAGFANVTLLFDGTVMRFGGWFGSCSLNGSNLLNVTFFDAANVQIGAVQNVSTFGSALVWFGWDSTVAVKSISFTGNLAPAMDDLQADAVPEPATFVALGLGVATLALRRKKA